MIVVFVLIPFLWSRLLGFNLNTRETFLWGSSFFWIILTPIIWLLNKYCNLPVTARSFWFLIVLITIFFLFYRLINKNKIKTCWPKIKCDWSLIIILIVYGVLHIAFYHFYVTMPESDGYDNLLTISEMMKTGVIGSHYRPLFFTAMTVLGQVTKIDMYQIHVFWMVILSSSYLIVISLLADINKIKIFWQRLLLFSFGLAVPVINMEIDFFRPQNLCLLLFPIIFYLEQKNRNYYALFISLIALAYHQFFIFPIIVLGLKIFFSLNKSKKILLLITGLLFFIFQGEKVFPYLPVNRIFEEIWKTDNWRWWFLNSYQTFPDNVQMGWPGVSGAVKYYGYYFGPIIIVCMGLMITVLKKIKKQKYWILMIFLLLLICEILPRLNVIYLPERFPLLIDLLVLLIIPFIFKFIKLKTWILAMLVLIGIFGSLYVARLKGSLTTREELEAAKWIKNNTTIGATILTQRVNKPMVIYFSQRKFLDPGKIFFEGDVLSGYYTDTFSKKSSLYDIKNCNECFVMYSFQKIDKLHGNRDYWSEYNYSGVNLEKFNSIFEKVYDKNGIIIWEM